MLRPLKRQFNPEMTVQLLGLAERFRQLDYPPGASRYYGVELARCIESGALLGALIVSCSLLELYVRALVVYHSSSAGLSTGSEQRIVEDTLEAKKGVKFSELIDELISEGLFEKSDGSSATKFYEEIRTPLLHGLPRRFVRQHGDGLMESLRKNFAPQLDREPISSRELEEIIEDHALENLEMIYEIIARNGVRSCNPTRP